MSSDVSNFDYPRIVDIADLQHPAIVANLRTEVDEPQNCPLVQGDISPRSVAFAQFVGGGGALFGYDDHHCSPDRLHDPTILACANFLSGLRVYDIRDPRHPREIAYDNTGVVAGPGVPDGTVPFVEAAAARPVIRRDLGQIWWVTFHTGFHAARFAPDRHLRGTLRLADAILQSLEAATGGSLAIGDSPLTWPQRAFRPLTGVVLATRGPVSRACKGVVSGPC